MAYGFVKILLKANFCDKLKLYGFDENSTNWFKSFLTGRSQRVKIGKTTSTARYGY